MPTDMQPDREVSTSTPSAAQTSRRAWLRKGAAVATPVVASLASSPVYAGKLCVRPSGFLSANTFASRNTAGGTCYTNKGPTYWGSCLNTSWPKALDGITNLSGVTFCSIFGTAGLPAGITTTSTMMDVVKGTHALGKYCVALYANVRAGVATANPYAMTEAEVVGVWTTFRTGTKSAMFAGTDLAKWTELDAVTWLTKLMG
jgi:hypothetical protein